jgi:F420-0:gamma-glutamyl ligase-like protein
MTKITDTDQKVTALGQGFQKLSDDIRQLITDEGLSGPLVDSINARLDAMTAAVAGVDSDVQAADPGTSSSSSS